MAWIVTSWRTEALEALVDTRAREAAQAIVAAAERDARRFRRVAERETADALAYLEVLERLGRETLETVRAQRRQPVPEARAAHHRALVPEPPHAPPVPAPEEIRVVDTRPARPAPPARPARASLRDSPLAELFRATVPTG
jgi:hypothetical protein